MKPWSEMSSRERDALVATEVMGWHSIINKDYGLGPNEEHPHRRCPDYTTDIKASWEIVEKLSPRCIFEMSRDRKGHYNAAFNRKAYIDLMGDGKSDIAAEAICLAALRAVGVEV